MMESDDLNGCLWARFGLDPKGGLIQGVRVEWREGLFSRVEPCPTPPREFPPDAIFKEHLVTPGLLNAHTHLEYSFLQDQLPTGEGFVPWLRAMIAARRALTPEQEPALRKAARQAINGLIGDGVTEVWDVSTYGWAADEIADSRLKAIVFEEWMAPRREDWESRWKKWSADFEARQARRPAGFTEQVKGGVAPHTPFTVCPPALEAVARWGRRRALPLAIHLAESPEERALLMEGDGGMSALLSEALQANPAEILGTGASAIGRAKAAGLLAPGTLAIHCNLPEPGEAKELAESGAGVVFCPGSHEFFGYPPYPLAEYREAGVRLLLGTDSLASNGRLSIRDEARRLAELAGEWNPLDILACATGSRLEGVPALVGRGRGRLLRGLPAQWALWQLGSLPATPSPESLLEAWLDEATQLETSSAII